MRKSVHQTNSNDYIEVSEWDELDEKQAKLQNNQMRLTYCAFWFLLLLLLLTMLYAIAAARENHDGKQSIDTLNLISLRRKIVEPPIHSVLSSKSIYNNIESTISWPGCLSTIPSHEIDDRKHIVDPPKGPVTIVCCNTTVGTLNIEVHPAWAPLGTQRFLDMVRSGFFSTNVGLFRALKGFLVQFGLAGIPAVQDTFHRKGNLKDDPPWLPLGPPGREINGIKRFQKGYLAYAGAGNNSRGTQLIMAFEDNQYLGGGSPWEVPFAQLFGKESYSTLSKIYTGYGESPSQGKIMNKGASYLKQEFPLLDYINACAVVRENVDWKYIRKQSTRKLN
eukprot:gene9265-12481_t